jgi:hypothetical protein
MKLKFTFFLIALFCLLTLGQSTKAQNDLEDQINKIDGNVDKITITADGQEYTFEGKDAEKLFKKIKSTKSHSFVWNTSDDSKNKKIIILDADGDEDEIEVESGDENVFIIKSGNDLDEMDEGMSKKVKVEIENGEKKVTVTTKENGEETTEVYEGKEADEYIEKMKSDNDDLDIVIEKDNGKKVKKIIIETEKEEE